LVMPRIVRFFANGLDCNRFIRCFSLSDTFGTKCYPI
jgi:hypothetical protein